MEREKTPREMIVELKELSPVEASRGLKLMNAMLELLRAIAPIALSALARQIAIKITAAKMGITLEDASTMSPELNVFIMMMIAAVVGIVMQALLMVAKTQYHLKFTGVLFVAGMVLAAWVAVQEAESAYGLYSALAIDFMAIEGFWYGWITANICWMKETLRRHDFIKQNLKRVDYLEEEVLPYIKELLDEIDAGIAKEKIEEE